MAKSRADRLSDALKILEFVHGPVRRFKDGTLAQQLASLVLRPLVGAEQADKVLRSLLEEFSDLNEIRISFTREVAAVLELGGIEDPRKPAGALRKFLERMYRKKNGVDLGFLKDVEEGEELDYEGLYRFLRSFRQVGDGGAAGLTSLCMPEGKFLGVPEVLRMASRIGLGGSKPTPARTRNALEEIAPESARFRTHVLLAEHTETTCRARGPSCAECPLASGCDYGRALLKREGKKPVRPPTQRVKKAPAPKKKPIAKKSVAKKSVAKKPVAKKAAAKKAAAKKAAKKPVAKKAPAKKPVAKKAPAKKPVAKKASAKKPVAKKPPAKKPAPKKPAAKKPAAKKPAAKKAPSKKPAPRKKG